jgi:hypothetical protein
MEHEKKRGRGRPKKYTTDEEISAIRAEYNRRHYLKKIEVEPNFYRGEKAYYKLIREYDIDPFWIERYGRDIIFLKKLKEIKSAVDAGVFINMLEHCDAVNFQKKPEV